MTSILLMASLVVSPLPGGEGESPYPAGADQPADTVPRSALLDTTTARSPGSGGVIQGKVLSDRSGMALPLVLVEVGRGDSYRAVLTDEKGRYQFQDVLPGRRMVRARSLDHAPHEVTVDVPRDGRVSLDLSLPVRPIDLPAIRVVTRPDEGVYMDDSGGTGLRKSPATTRLRALEASPGAAEIGLARAARSANRTDPGNASSVLFVRGGASDLKLVLLDGAPVSSPFHLGGVIDPLPDGVIEGSTVHRGGSPARMDGGISYVLEMETRSDLGQEGHRASGSADLVGARARAEGPLPGGSYTISGRSIHAAGADRILDSPLPLEYSDALARAHVSLSDRDTVSVTGFWNREAVRLDGHGATSPSRASWGNRAGSVRYRGRAGETRIDITAAGGEFRARIPIGMGTGDFASGTSRRTRIVAEARREIGRLDASAGATYRTNVTRYRAVSDRGEPSGLEHRGTGRTLAAFSDVRWNASPELELRTGLRGNVFLDADESRLSPRIQLTWTPIPDLALSASSGRYHQYVRSAASLLPGSLGSSDDGTGASPGATGDLSIAGATHYTLSARGRPTGELTVGGETYLKSFDDPPGGVDFRTVGFDGWADWSHDTWSAWAGLVMSWTWAPETALTPSEIQSEERLEIHDRRLVTGGFRAPLPSDVRISMEVTTSTGLPFTPFPATTTAGGGSGSTTGGGTGADIPTVDVPRIIRTPRSSYLRVDAEIYRSWSARVMDTPVRITPYVRVLNALDRNDALFYRYVRDEDLVEQRSLGVVPLLPVVGLEWSVL